MRLQLLKLALKEREFILLMKLEIGKRQDHWLCKRQYNLEKTENGIVSVNAYGVLDGIVFPLILRYLNLGLGSKKDIYKTKPQLAIEIINELIWDLSSKLF